MKSKYATLPAVKLVARRYLVSGRVQGVGFRHFVLQVAAKMKVSGYVRNLDDGRVEAYVIGTEAQQEQMVWHLSRGPRWSDVRGVEALEAAMLQYEGFRVTH